MSNRTANRRLWRTTDDRVVEDGDPDAKLLLAAGPGDEIDPALDHLTIPAKFLEKGTDTKADREAAAAAAATEPPAEPVEAKAAETPPNKSRKATAAKRTTTRRRG